MRYLLEFIWHLSVILSTMRCCSRIEGRARHARNEPNLSLHQEEFVYAHSRPGFLVTASRWICYGYSSVMKAVQAVIVC